MQYGWYILWFIIAVSLLVTVHEFGHFWVARKLGFKVLRFSVGFGKPLLKKIGRAPDYTEYVIAAVPLGGYVRMLDERDGTVAPSDAPRAFGNKPPWQRILVMLAGPAANILFAILVLWAMFWSQGVTDIKPVVGEVTANSPAASAGLRSGDLIRSVDGNPMQDRGDVSLGLLDAFSDDGVASLEVRSKDGSERKVTLLVEDTAQRHRLTEPNRLYEGLGFEFWIPTMPPVLAAVESGGPAAAAGLAAGDRIVSMDGKPVNGFNEFASYVRARPGEQVMLAVQREGTTFSRRVKIGKGEVEGSVVGRLMVAAPTDIKPYIPAELVTRSNPGAFDSLEAAVAKSWQMTVAQAKFFVRMLTGDFSTKNISGFITIAKVSGETASAGAASFLMLLVLLSLSLGFLNLLPIPILDGGQIMFQLAEWAKGRPLSERTLLVGQQAGLLLLALLMGLALFNDLSGIFAARS